MYERPVPETNERFPKRDGRSGLKWEKGWTRKYRAGSQVVWRKGYWYVEPRYDQGGPMMRCRPPAPTNTQHSAGLDRQTVVTPVDCRDWESFTNFNQQWQQDRGVSIQSFSYPATYTLHYSGGNSAVEQTLRLLPTITAIEMIQKRNRD